MDDVEQLKILLKKYLEVKIEVDDKFSGYSDIAVTLIFDGEVISTDKTFIKKN